MAAARDGNGIEIRLLAEGFGAEIHGVYLAAGLSDAAFAQVRKAFADYGVIFFRDQKLSPDQHLAFAERWGEINVNRFFRAVDGHPRIAEVCKEPDQRRHIGHRGERNQMKPLGMGVLEAEQRAKNLDTVKKTRHRHDTQPGLGALAGLFGRRKEQLAPA